jgi:hypothetical protein
MCSSTAVHDAAFGPLFGHATAAFNATALHPVLKTVVPCDLLFTRGARPLSAFAPYGLELDHEPLHFVLMCRDVIINPAVLVACSRC